MRLRALFEGAEYSLLCGTLDKDVKSLSYHSDEAAPGTVFFALKGAQSDGRDYIVKLIKEGVEVFVTEAYNKEEKEKYRKLLSQLRSAGATLIAVPDAGRALAFASKSFFKKPDEELITIGITGTKGKTGTAYILKAILEKAGIKTGIIGTVQQGFEGHYSEAVNTTPQSYEIYRMLREMVSGGCKAVVMEVSSQALMQHRTDGIDFDIGIFTNLSPDHIGKGEHKSFDEYAYWKSRLFAQTKTAVVNADSPYADMMLAASACEKLVKFSLSQAEAVMPYRGGEKLATAFTYRGTAMKLPLPGSFNLSNALAAMTAAAELGIEPHDMAAALENISIRGRSELIPSGRELTIVLDYAHNGVALENLLEALRLYEPSTLIAVFGCGGNRDRSRRLEMGRAAGRLADFTVVTTDNPRDEAPERIAQDIARAICETGGRYTLIPDRAEAIAYAIEKAQEGSIVAVCGKGHECYQLIGHEKIYFDDREVIKAVIESQETKK